MTAAMKDRSLAAITARAEQLSIKTGKPTCMICRHMLVKSHDEATCDISIHGGTIYTGMINHLQAMTQRAQRCDLFDSMLED